MSITTAMTTSFKQELLQGLHDLDGLTLKLALIKSGESGTYGAASTNYSDITGKKHIFDKEVFKLRETEYLYCYEHKTLHKMEVIPYKKLTGNPILKAKKGNPEG